MVRQIRWLPVRRRYSTLGSELSQIESPGWRLQVPGGDAEIWLAHWKAANREAASLHPAAVVTLVHNSKIKPSGPYIAVSIGWTSQGIWPRLGFITVSFVYGSSP